MKCDIRYVFKYWISQFFKSAHRVIPNQSALIKSDEDYFKVARSWADDMYGLAIASRNRYKVAFFGITGLSGLLAFCIFMLVPMQHTELVVVHESPSGYVWLSTTKNSDRPPLDWMRTQSEIAHYVRARESYDPLLYQYQTHEVRLFSTSQVQSEYEWEQSSHNKSAPINVLGAKGYRAVIVNNVLLLDSASKNKNGLSKHVNLAQVNYEVENHLLGQNKITKIPYTALVSWEYKGVPADPSKMLDDWDGFTVTKFVIQPVNVGDDN